MTLEEISIKTKSEYLGDGTKNITGLCSQNSPSLEKILFVSNKQNIPHEPEKFGVILTSQLLKNYFKGCNLLLSSDPKLCFAILTDLFKEKKMTHTSIPDSSFISENSMIGENFKLGHNTVIEDNVSIGDNVTIGHNVSIHRNTHIGSNVFIDSGTVIGSEGFGNTFSGEKWFHIYHLGSVIIKDNVSIGANCTIDRGTIDSTIISNGVIIDNLVHIAHNVKIGEHTAIAAKVGIAGSSVIGKRNMIGGMVGIIDHIKTADDVIVSATSTVSKDIKEPGTYTGIMPISKHFKWKRIAILLSKLDKIAKLNFLKK